ncbi:GH24119 [Drosophila grimshawi]|uniref:GH24119 n=1 Tax=Drosophila grimshawi TaxID=7222 RepID=B4JNL2_DROGR|nr:GH24119 [Drosophila grimshawi]
MARGRTRACPFVAAVVAESATVGTATSHKPEPEPEPKPEPEAQVVARATVTLSFRQDNNSNYDKAACQQYGNCQPMDSHFDLVRKRRCMQQQQQQQQHQQQQQQQQQRQLLTFATMSE